MHCAGTVIAMWNTVYQSHLEIANLQAYLRKRNLPKQIIMMKYKKGRIVYMKVKLTAIILSVFIIAPVFAA